MADYLAELALIDNPNDPLPEPKTFSGPNDEDAKAFARDWAWDECGKRNLTRGALLRLRGGTINGLHTERIDPTAL